MGNRLQLAVLREAFHIVQQGIADAATVDDVMKYSLGRRWNLVGPIASIDLGGLDVFYNISTYLFDDMDNGTGPSPLLAEKVKEGNLGCLCSISCCGFSHDDFSGLGRACRPRNGLNWMVLVSPPERTGKDYDQHAPSTVYPSFAAERGIRRVDRAENTCQRADGA